MKLRFFTKVFLISLLASLAYADDSPKFSKSKVISWRFHDQWNVDESAREKIHTTYGEAPVNFDQSGRPTPQGLSPSESKRWQRLYNLCMSDGCYYCDADAGEGSCELGTCGPQNAYCKPHIGTDGQPICGDECAAYAFRSILICNDLSDTR